MQTWGDRCSIYLWFKLQLLAEVSQTELFQSTSKINNHLNLNTRYFNRVFQFCKCNTHSRKKKRFRVNVLLSLSTLDIFSVHVRHGYTDGYYFLFQFYLQFEYRALMLNELINSGQVSTWLHLLNVLPLQKCTYTIKAFNLN